MIQRVTLALSALAMMIGVGCTLEPEEPEEGTGSELNAQSTALWPVENGVAKVRVCWLPAPKFADQFPVAAFGRPTDADVAARKAWVKAIVEAQWNKLTPLEFVGWSECGDDKDKMVQMQPIVSSFVEGGYDPGQPHTQGLGKFTVGKKAFLNLFFGDEYIYRSRLYADADARKTNVDPKQDTKRIWVPAACLQQFGMIRRDIGDAKVLSGVMTTFKSCLQNNVLHEFGHVAGFAHEQYRSDISKACRNKLGITKSDIQNVPKASRGDTPLGPFEAESIMSYCRSNPAPTLTDEDVQMTKHAYSGKATTGNTGGQGTPGKNRQDGQDG